MAETKLKTQALDTSSIIGGWFSANETWTYASADSPTFTFTISGDLTSKYSAGMRIKLTQTTVKYFIITAVSYSSPNTTITVYGGTDYTLANAAITSPYFSSQKAPQGFPLSPEKWTVTLTDTSSRDQTSITADTWYNLGSLSLSIPIGIWNTSYKIALRNWAPGNYADAKATLSTSSSSESDSTKTSMINVFPTGATATIAILSVTCSCVITLTSKTTHYLLAKGSYAGSTLNFRGDLLATIVRCVCAYL